ncbi:1375_t:CDS:2 [Rhizophagus irregularis]|nr:1375_t:CDS:2 [Rhizophagus irregularis]
MEQQWQKEFYRIGTQVLGMDHFLSCEVGTVFGCEGKIDFYVDKSYDSICELNCNTSVGSTYFYGLSQCCQNIQRLNIVNIDISPNDGIVKLIEVRKNLKYFEYLQDFIHTLLPCILPKFHKLKKLAIDVDLFFTGEEELLKSLIYHDLEILNIDSSNLNVISSIIENCGGRLKKILFRPYDLKEIRRDFKNSNTLNFIRKVYENCPLIEYLSIVLLPSKEHFNEFEKLLKICKNLKYLWLGKLSINRIESLEEITENGGTLLKIFINSAPTNLKELRFFEEFKFSLENLEEFLGKWKGCPFSILTCDSLYESEDYKKLIDKYKNNGIIKEFRYEIDYRELINSFIVL